MKFLWLYNDPLYTFAVVFFKKTILLDSYIVSNLCRNLFPQLELSIINLKLLLGDDEILKNVPYFIKIEPELQAD